MPRRQTTLQIYCKTYKQAQVDQTHGLLRKARRLDKILEASADTASTTSLEESAASTPSAVPVPGPGPSAPATTNGYSNGLRHAGGASSSSADPHCYRCQTEFSPFFHEVATATAMANAHHGQAGEAPPKSWLCHKCHTESRKSFPVIIGIGAS